MINLNYIKYVFSNYKEADINQSWEYECCRINEIFGLETFLKSCMPCLKIRGKIIFSEYVRQVVNFVAF